VVYLYMDRFSNWLERLCNRSDASKTNAVAQ
jgi:hypothetical protein